MTLPASGTIAISNFSTELGLSATANNSSANIYNNTKTGQQSYAMNAYYSKAYYRKTNAGNCTVANCAVAGNCTFQCTNCSNCTAVNCVNCDAISYIQTNCNCVTSYNCSPVTNVLYDCNCLCSTDSSVSTCFPAGATVLMADGSLRSIETVQGGEWVMGADGKPAEVSYLHIAVLGPRKMYVFAEGGHEWSDEHLHWTRENGKEWWWSANPDNWLKEVDAGLVAGLEDNYSVRTGRGLHEEFAHVDGWVKRSVVEVSRPYETPVYLPVTAGIPVIVNGYVVTGGTDYKLFDYETFKWNQLEQQPASKDCRILPSLAPTLPLDSNPHLKTAAFYQPLLDKENTP